MGRLRHAINIVMGILIVGYITYFLYHYATAESRIRALCNQIKPSMTLLQLNMIAKEHGMSKISNNQSGIHFMVENITFGRYGCKIIFEIGVVKNAEYNFAD